VTTPASLHVIGPDALDRLIHDLADILHACVGDGASVGFILPFSRAEAEAFWRDAVRPQVDPGRRILIGAALGGRHVGTAQLIHDMPPNQPHDGLYVMIALAGPWAALDRRLDRTAAALGRDHRGGCGASSCQSHRRL